MHVYKAWLLVYYYDFTTFDPDPFPFPFYEGYLSQPHVQSALGLPLNWTQSSSPVATTFRGIGDYPRPGWLEDLTYLLENNIKVALIYGDGDYACNWLGNEAVFLALNYTHSAAFRATGYAAIQISASYIGGQVRQDGNLSFSRVYESGHEVPAYQAETAYRIFIRALFNQDIATGTGTVDTVTNAEYGTQGPSDIFGIKNKDPPDLEYVCYVLDPGAMCMEIEKIADGTAVVRDWVLVEANSAMTMVLKRRGTVSKMHFKA